MPLPRFRPLDIIPVEHEGKTVFVVHDNEGINDQRLILPPLPFVVGSMLDGTIDVEELQKRIEQRFPGNTIPIPDLEAIVHDLDQHYLLESPRLVEKRLEILNHYRTAPHRPAKFVTGTAVNTSLELDQYFLAKDAAGKPASPAATDGIRAIIAPHIDFQRGGWCYTHAYREIAERSQADLYVILGVAHVSPENPFVVTSKSYQTPLGLAETDAEVFAALQKRIPKCTDDEIVHRNEHSAEFQAVFLRHVRSHRPFKVLPILCSPFEIHCGDRSPSTAARVEEFIQALKEVLDASGRKVCLVAGVDYAHVGPRFGDQVELDQKLIEWMVEDDRKSLDRVAAGDAEGFWNSVMHDGNRRHVCGHAATYATLRLLGPASGKLLKYGYAPDPAGGGGMVSFAAATFQ